MAAFIGQSSEQKFAKAAASSVSKALSLAIGERQSELKSEITTLLGVPADASFIAIGKAYNSAKPELKEAVNKLIKDSGTEAARSSGSFKVFREGLAQSGKTYQDLINTFKNSTPLGKFAEDSSKQILELAKLIGDDKMGLTEKLSGLQEVAGRMDFLQLFPAEAAGNILQTSRELSKLKDELAQVDMVQKAYNETIGEKTDKKTELEKFRGKDPVKFYFEGGGGKVQQLEGDIQSIKNASKNLDLQKAKIQDGLNSATQVFSIAMRDGLLANIKTFTEGLRDAAARAGLELRKVATEGMADPKLKNKETANIERAGLALDRNMLKVQESLINSNAQLKLAIMENTLAIGLSKPGVVQAGESVEQALARPENKALAMQQTAITTFRDNINAKIGDIQKKLEDQKSYRTGSNAGMVQGYGDALNTAQARAALEAEFAKINGKVAGVNLKEKFGDIDADKGESLRVIAAAQKRVDQDQQRLDQVKATMGDDDFKAAQLELITNKANLDYATKIIEANATVLKSKTAQAATGTQIGISDVGYAKQLFDLTDKQAAADRDIATSGAKQAADISAAVVALTAAESSRQHTVSLANQELGLEVEMNQAKQQVLQTAYSLGFLDENTLKSKSEILKLEEIRLDQSIKLRAAYEKEFTALAALDQAKAAAGGTLTGSAAAADLAKREQVAQTRAEEVKGIRAVTQARTDDLKVMSENDLRQQAYTQAFKQAFKGMEDAIVNFTKTGKLSFKDMINGFIEALLRYEIQQQQIMLFKGMGMEGGLAKSFISTGKEGMDWFTSLFKSAQGSVYDTGLTQFAKGGMFTNSVVTSPTLFKFAQGTGLMGEAGPEAIMPLKRDNQGNLGVRGGSGGGNVDVVVNNYGNEKATTKETMDSRGNRRIEVMVGDMVAGELNRVGSNTQQAMTASYGTSPLVARR
jgi:lambda family phage tail tape measure protein